MALATRRKVKVARCRNCGAVFQPMSDMYVTCPVCGSTDIEITEQEVEEVAQL